MSFAHYLLQVNLYLIVFYGFYKLLLEKETYFKLNRFYLVAAGFLSLCIPFIRLEWLTEQSAAKQVYTTVKWDAVLQQATIVTEVHEGFNWGSLLVYIYCCGIIFFLCKLIFNLLTVNKLIKKASKGAAFSFFRKKVIDQSLPQSSIIDSHEEAHIKQWHTVDVLFFELIGILTWLNPVIYLYKKAIKNIHEFLADEHAANYQGDKAAYALLILSKSFGINTNALASNFFEKSLIKQRIYMLHKERSGKIAILKYGISIPLFAIFIVFSSATVRKNKKLIAFSEQIPMEKPLELVQEMSTKPIQFTYTEKAPAKINTEHLPLESNWKDFYKFLSKTVRYPKEAQENAVQGNTQITFTIKDGKISNVGKNADLGNGCDEEVMKAILSYRDFKEIENGKYVLVVSFVLNGSESTIKNEKTAKVSGYKPLSKLSIVAFAPPTTSSTERNDKVYDFVSIEKVPEFPGGMTKFYEYLRKNMEYPAMAQENNVQGKVWLAFTVEKNGALSDVSITRGLGSGTDEEALRVIKESPKWLPGIQNGRPVRVKYNININFTLDDQSKKNPVNDQPLKVQGLQLKSYLHNDGIKLRGAEVFNGVVVVDGIKQSDNLMLASINPNNIESISVLKDLGSASLYGDKAKSGVILITTKTNKQSTL